MTPDIEQKTIGAIDRKYDEEVGVLFHTLFASIASAPAAPSLSRRVMAILSATPSRSDVDAAVARFRAGLTDLQLAYSKAREVCANKQESI